MRLVQLSILVVLLLCLGAPSLRADEGDARAPAASTADRALEALKLRLEARMKEGELLAQSGRLEEALEAYRSVGELYDRGMQEIRSLLATPAASAARADRPFARGEGVGGAFRGRGGARREREGADRPGRTFDRAIDDALRWLAAHQAPNGGWEADDFAAWCDDKRQTPDGLPDGAGKALYDPGVTGLALCAFLGAGYTNRGQHPFAKTVSRGLRYLKGIQDPEGCFGARSTQQYMYNHGLASLAMLEAYGMTGSPIFKGSAQRALDFIALTRNPYFAWRYGVRPGDNDTSVTAWMTMCLASAQAINRGALKRGKPAPLTVDEAAFEGVRSWLDKVTDPDTGRVGYVQRGTGSARPMELVDRFPAEKTEAMTAAGMLCRMLLGEDPARSGILRKGADLLRAKPPVWNTTDGSIDMYYWYYGTLAMFQVGGTHWQAWQRQMQKAMVETQREDTDPCRYKGSWDPIGPWGLDGGRVYATALMCMCLQVTHRHVKVFGAAEDK